MALYISGWTVHQLKCCDIPDYTYSNCKTHKSGYGIGIDCQKHRAKTLLGENFEFSLI